MSARKDLLIEVDENESPPPTYTPQIIHSLPYRPSLQAKQAPPYKDLDTDLEEQPIVREESVKNQGALCGLGFLGGLFSSGRDGKGRIIEPAARSEHLSRPFAWQSGHSQPRLTIHAAAFADADITSKVRCLVSSNQTLTIDMMNAQFIFGDPWPNTRKTLCILYEYDSRGMELLTTHEEGGVVTIDHRDPVDDSRISFLQHATADDRILAVVWGLEDGLCGQMGNYRKRALERSDTVWCTQKWFGCDGYPIGGNSCVVFLRDGNGVNFVAARENECCRLAGVN